MISATNIIHSAYQMLGAHSTIKPVSAERMEIARTELNSMMDEWTDDDIDLGYIQVERVSDIVSIPLSARRAVKSNLAIRLSPYVDNGTNIVSLELEEKAFETFERVKRNNQIVFIPNKQVSGTMPLGAGNERTIDSRIFAGQDFVLDDGKLAEPTVEFSAPPAPSFLFITGTTDFLFITGTTDEILITPG